MNDYQKFIAISRYARWIDEENRRETWEETVQRYVDYITEKVKGHLPKQQIIDAITKLEVMPSMRALMTAGPALERDNTAGYNCSYLPVDDPKAFDEAMYILLCGTGVGFSVERQYVNNLPTIPYTDMEETDDVISVADSKEGWARAFKDLISYLYSGRIPQINMDKVRPAGSRLNIFGGRASGPEPLVELFDFTINTFKKASGRKLYPIECHDIMCKIGEVVVVGGVRRSALISLSNLNDDQMRHAKSGEWWKYNKQRALANNSVVYKTKPDMGTFMREWVSLYESQSGERGIFNRKAAVAKAQESDRRKFSEFGCNPCSEIILRPYQFCNLSEVVARQDDCLTELENKVRIATIIGTFQSTLTDFKYLRKVWQKNTEEERLLGVSLTGILDNQLLSRNDAYLEDTLTALKQVAIDTNLEYSEMLNIPQSTAITCVKPSGTVSQLVDSASGIHARHSKYYIRTVRGSNKDPTVSYTHLTLPTKA